MEDLVKMVGISKYFPGVQALKEVDLSLKKGEVHALIGENGAGKSTLIKILGGIYPKDQGEIYIENQQVEITNPHDAQNLGISIIPQELILVEGFTVAENIFLGREPGKHVVKFHKMDELCQQLLKKWDINLSPKQRISDLSIAQRQLVLIAKALLINSKILVMDEPTARLTQQEIINLFQIIERLKAGGLTILYVSHHLEEIFKICNRVTIFRDGQRIKTLDIEGTNTETLIALMVGRELKETYPKEKVAIGDELLRVENISLSKVLQDVTFTIRRGEIVGIFGLVGSGRTTLLRSIFGAVRQKSGKVFIGGQEVTISSPQDAVAHKMAFVPEERRAQGLVLERTVKENITLASLTKFCQGIFIRKSAEKKAVLNSIQNLAIKTPGPDSRVSELSGGNQQKVVVAKWLESGAEIFFFDEPTRGIDIGAKSEIYRFIGQLAKQGAAIVIVSSELPELLGVTDRLLVMKNGSIITELKTEITNQEEVLSYAIGGTTYGA